jgi:hypothetical protein
MKTKPASFRVGDIVEAQVSFVVVPLKDNKYKMVITLRALAILNASVTQVSDQVPLYNLYMM